LLPWVSIQVVARAQKEEVGRDSWITANNYLGELPT